MQQCWHIRIRTEQTPDMIHQVCSDCARCVMHQACSWVPEAKQVTSYPVSAMPK